MHNVSTMYVHRPTQKVGKGTYQSVLLTESYREDGKVKRRTLANMTPWPAEMVSGIEALGNSQIARVALLMIMSTIIVHSSLAASP